MNAENFAKEFHTSDEALNKAIDALNEASDLLNALQSLPIEHDERGHAFRRIKCRSMDDMGAWVGAVSLRLNTLLEGKPQ